MKKEIADTIKVIIDNREIETEIHIQRKETKHDRTVTAALSLDGMDYVGIGKNCDVDEPLADLQNKLPDGAIIKCCVTCQYGHFCPYGSDGDTMLCIFPETISDKLDLVDLMAENKYAIKKNADCCENFAPAKDEFYSYNSFLRYLKG